MHVATNLSKIQQAVYDLDQQQVRVKDIADRLGISPNRATNVKTQLKKLGLSVKQWHRPAGQGPTRTVKTTSAGLARQFCSCGLSLPCNGCLVGRSGYVQPENTQAAMSWNLI